MGNERGDAGRKESELRDSTGLSENNNRLA
jgi:hypothetical protein